MEQYGGRITEMSRRFQFYVISVILVFAGVLLIWIGFKNGQAEAVLRKAIRICLECIGIG